MKASITEYFLDPCPNRHLYTKMLGESQMISSITGNTSDSPGADTIYVHESRTKAEHSMLER
jgi:hypothetical protein